MRHGSCSIIKIKLTSNQIQVEDNGIGGMVIKKESYGLVGVSERLIKIGAKIQFISQSSGSLIIIAL